MLNTSLLELLTEAELQCVIAHELGHLKCDHGVWLTIGNVLATTSSSVLPVVSSAVEESLFKWMRAAELTCDRCSPCSCRQSSRRGGARFQAATCMRGHNHDRSAPCVAASLGSVQMGCNGVTGRQVPRVQVSAAGGARPKGGRVHAHEACWRRTTLCSRAQC
jgi:Peptidase family M48